MTNVHTKQPLDPDPMAWFMAVCTGISALSSLHQMILSRRTSTPTRVILNATMLDLVLSQFRRFEDALREILKSTREIRDNFDQADILMDKRQREAIPFRFGQTMDGLSKADLEFVKQRISMILQRVNEINIYSVQMSDFFAHFQIPADEEFISAIGYVSGELNSIFFSGKYSLQSAEYQVIEILEGCIRATEGMSKALQQRGGH